MSKSGVGDLKDVSIEGKESRDIKRNTNSREALDSCATVAAALLAVGS
jgi:hypothetical protein